MQRLLFTNEGNARGVDSSEVYNDPSLQNAVRKHVHSTSIEMDCLPKAPTASANVIVPAKESYSSLRVVENFSMIDVRSQMLSSNGWKGFYNSPWLVS